MTSSRTRRALTRLAEIVTRELGIQMPDSKLNMLEGRLSRRVRALELGSVGSYEELLQGQDAGSELAAFYDVVTTNKTDFFREPRHFEQLSARIVPSYGPARARPYHVWCAGCATGQEAYTLAMVLSEHARLAPGFRFDIFATDISTRALAQAEHAVYDQAAIEPVPLELRKRYLLRSKDPSKSVVRIAPELRERVRFARLNFMDASYRVNGPFDAVFCRNVLIYFDKMTQERVVQRLCAQLRPGGHLFVGHAESIAGFDVPLESEGSSIFRKRP